MNVSYEAVDCCYFTCDTKRIAMILDLQHTYVYVHRQDAGPPFLVVNVQPFVCSYIHVSIYVEIR